MNPWITNGTQLFLVVWCCWATHTWPSCWDNGPFAHAHTHKKNYWTATLPPYYYNHHILDEDQSTQLVNNHKYLVLMGSIVAVVLSLYTLLLHCSHWFIFIAFVTWFLHSAVVIVVIVYHRGSDCCSCPGSNCAVILFLLLVDWYPALGCCFLHFIHCDDGLGWLLL
jgi:hypothetical protein